MAIINTLAVASVVFVLFCSYRVRSQLLVLSVYSVIFSGKFAGEYYIHLIFLSVAFQFFWLKKKFLTVSSVQDLFSIYVNSISRLTIYDLIVAYCGIGLIFLSPVFTFTAINVAYDVILVGCFYYVVFYSNQVLCRDIWEFLATIQIMKIVMIEMLFNGFTIFSCIIVALFVLVLTKLLKTKKITL